jgi:nitrous oxidase accessory protein
MKKYIVLVMVLSAWLPTANARTLVVGEEASFTLIQEAIRQANPGDTILVQPGHYAQHTIIIDKPLYLLGKGMPQLDAEHQAVELFVVMVDSVVIEGFTLMNVGVSFLKELAAIKVRQGHHGIIRNNEILNCFFGVYLEYATYYQVVGNQVVDQADDEASAGNAIHVWKGDHLEIAHNILTGHRDGIYLEFVNDSQIHHNQSYRNLRYGLHFMFSNNDAYSANEFRENGAGVAVMFSKKIKMQNNRFANNWGGASYGLLLKEISDGEISGNHFVRNTIGILGEGANRIVIEKNQFSLNGTALDMKGNSLDNEILANNFLANTFEVVTNSQRNNNRYERNYWSGYVGYDLDRDGFGDEPYRPVNLFARITDQIPAATLMLHSFFVSLLEFSERVFPTIIPATLTDQYPQMQPYAYDQD